MNPAQIQRGIIALKSNGPLKWNRFRSELGNPDRLTKEKVITLPEMFGFDNKRLVAMYVNLLVVARRSSLRKQPRSVRGASEDDAPLDPWRKKKHGPAKAQILQWLLEVEHSSSFWKSLKGAAQSRNWKGFSNVIRKEWVGQGRMADVCNFLQNSQHSLHVWHQVREPGTPFITFADDLRHL